jgi:hypothetical protein
MAKVSYRIAQEPFVCQVSEIKAIKNADSPCCEGLFKYEPVVLDFGDRPDHQLAVLGSGTKALLIETPFQNLWLLDITDIILMDGCRLGIKFNNSLLY